MKCNTTSNLIELGFVMTFKRGNKFNFSTVREGIMDRIECYYSGVEESDVIEVHCLRLRYSNPDMYEGNLNAVKTKKGWFLVYDFYEEQSAERIDGRKVISEIKKCSVYSYWLENMSFKEENTKIIVDFMLASNQLTVPAFFINGCVWFKTNRCEKTYKEIIEVMIDPHVAELFGMDIALLKEDIMSVFPKYCNCHFHFHHDVYFVDFNL